MIRSIRHKGLRRLYEDDDPRGSTRPAPWPTWTCRFSGCTRSRGELKGFWAVTVRANWRVIFSFADPDAFDVDYVDCH